MPAKTFGIAPASTAGTHLCGLGLAGWCWAVANDDDNLGGWSWPDPAATIEEVNSLARDEQLEHVAAAAAMTLTKRADRVSPDNGAVGEAISAAIAKKRGVTEAQRQTAIRYGMALRLIETTQRRLAALGADPGRRRQLTPGLVASSD